jgi:hypothetical protein
VVVLSFTLTVRQILVMSFAKVASAVGLPLHLATPERAETLARLEIPEPHRHFQILIISPEAQVEPVALVATLEATPAQDFQDLARRYSTTDRMTRDAVLGIVPLIIQGRVARRVEGLALEKPLHQQVTAVAAEEVLGSPMPGTVLQLNLALLARVEPQVEDPVALVGIAVTTAPLAQHLVHRGQVVEEPVAAALFPRL